VSQGACVDTSSVYAIIVTGITDPLAHLIALYPNPTNGSFTIDLGRVYTEAMVTITRYDGQIIWKENILNSHKLDLDVDLPPGIYMVIITVEGKEVVFKLLKN
jgi:hypothetical protein